MKKLMKLEGKKRKSSVEIEEDFKITDWLKSLMFWQYGLVYMFARLLNNISAAQLQFFLVYVLKVNDVGGKKSTDTNSIYLAIYPGISFTASVLMSAYLGSLYQKIGRKKSVAIGLII